MEKNNTMELNLACVIVTYNRLDYLKKALDCYDQQTKMPDYLIIVDNHSTDGISDYLDGWEKKRHGFKCIILHLPENIGGSGGFYSGCQKALELGADYIWMADDDAYPALNVIECFQNHLHNEPRARKASAVCTVVLEKGRIQLDHRRRYKLTWNNMIAYSIPLEEYKKSFFTLQLFSYVGVIIRSDILRKVGLCEKGFFIYNDDAEHALRVGKYGEIICYTDMEVVHAKPQNFMKKDGKEFIDWRYYYSARNFYLMLKRHFKKQYFFHWHLDYIKAKIHLLSNRKVDKYQVRLAALMDAKYDKLGMHEIYKPGWHA